MRKSDRVRREEVYNTGGKNKKNRGRVRSRSCRARRVALRRRFFFLNRERATSKRASERRTSRLREPVCGAAPTSLDGRAVRER